MRESAGVAELRLQIENCDGVLSVFEKMLEKCQSDLGNIAGGVRHMKERADAFEMLSKNRQRAETSVAGWIETAAIPRGLSKAIHDVDVGDALYCQHLKVLQDKLAFVAKYTKCGGDMPVSCANAAPLLRRLRARAVERICVHLKAEMRKLEDDNELLYALTLGQAGKADSNKVIYALTLGQAGGAALKQLHDRQHQLLRSSPLILFLISSSTDGDGGEEVYGQMLTQYTNTMGAALASQLRAEYRTYAAYGVRDCITCRHSLFPEIESEKGRMALIVSKGAVLGHAGLAAVKGMTQGIAQGVVGVSTGQLRQLRHFNPSTWDMGGQGSEADWMLGDRLEHMQGLTSVHHKDKEANNQEHQGKDANNQEQVSTHQPPELVLHRLLLSFGDLLDGESGIVCKLFPRRSGDELIGMFVPCVSGIREAAAQLIESTVDPVSLLLMALSLETSQRKICDVLCCDPGTGAAFDDFYMWGYMTVWPKFKMSVQAQVAAVRRAADTCLLSLPSHMAHVEAFIVRYAHLSGAFYVVDAQLETQSREMAGMSLKLMWSEVWLLTSTLSLQLPAANKRSIFILNQLHAILDVYYQLGVCSAACGPVRDKVRQEIERLLPLLLGQRYKALIALLAELEAAQLQPSRSSINVNAAVSVLMGFKEHWKMDAHTCSAFLTASCSRPQVALAPSLQLCAFVARLLALLSLASSWSLLISIYGCGIKCMGTSRTQDPLAARPRIRRLPGTDLQIPNIYTYIYTYICVLRV